LNYFNKNIFLILLYGSFLISFLSANKKFQFSATNLENINNEEENKRIFQNNVIISNEDILLYSNKATHYPDSFKIFLEGDIKMYELNDSLFCDKLILYDQKLRKFSASGNINLFK